MRIIGISAFYHDSAAALVVDGKVVAAAQEERFTRKKHDAAFPKNAVEYCLGEGGCTLTELDAVAFYDKPFIKFERLLETYLAFAPRGLKSFGMAIPAWLREKLFQKSLLRDKLREISGDFDAEKLLFSEHHLAHAASAFFPSPFEEAAVLTLDGVGEWTTSSLAIGTGSDLRIHKELHFPHSLGLLYSAFTYYTGFKVNSGEYKVMGLAPYGEPKYLSKIHDIVDLKEDGTFRLDQRYFNYCTGLTMTDDRFSELFGQPVRKPEELLTQFHMDIAASVQAFTEEVLLRLARSVRADTGMRNLCLAGGVALNCVANGKIFAEKIFDDIWIQPAAGDAGGSVGAALAAYHDYFGQKRAMSAGALDEMQGAYLGPRFSPAEAETRLQAAGARFAVHPDRQIVDLAAAALSEGKAVGWMQGRMEFGPRSLGNRSILGDPRSPTMQKTLNLKVKYRESFRPFAPSVLREDVAEWFEFDTQSPYMLLVADVKTARRRKMSEQEAKLFGIDKLNVPRSEIPAVTHVDYSARIQTVHEATNPKYHALLARFKELTGCPVLVNTSFNVRGEPIVCGPEDAFRCFMGSELDVLVVENCYLVKEEQDPALKLDYRNVFDPD
ncbi:MAG TPA: carbamoyltransferase [Bradyrhizobium sp.]|nr:carbamoyltransferase [Bradyrhizobium sp.]